MLHGGNEVGRPLGILVAANLNAGSSSHGVGQRAPAMPQVHVVHQRVALVIFRALHKKARRLGSIPVLAAALREQSESHQRIQQKGCAARACVDLLPHLCGARALPYRSKNVEFKRCKKASARHVAADHLIQAIGQHSCSLAGSHSLTKLFSMLDRHGLHRCGILPHQPVHGFAHGPAIGQMLVHDLGYIGWLNAPVPHPLRINDHHRPFVAQSKAAARRHLHIVAQTAHLDLAIQLPQHRH